MRYLKYFEATVLGQKVKDIEKLNNLYSILGIKFKYSYQSKSMCLVNFNLNNEGPMNYIAKVIANSDKRGGFKDKEVKRTSFVCTLEGSDGPCGDFKFQLTSTNTFQQVLDRLLEYFEENIDDNIHFGYVDGWLDRMSYPMFKNVVIKYTKYLMENQNPDTEVIWKIIGEELSKSGVNFKVLNFIKTNNQILWDRISNETNEVGSGIGNLGF